MTKNNTDKFEVTKTTNIFQENNNFFLGDESSFAKQHGNFNSEPTRRLNDYDFNLLKEDAYKDVSDDLFKLEYKIAKYEAELKNIDIQIQLAVDIQDKLLEEDLLYKKSVLQEDLEALLAIYNDKNLSTKILDAVSKLLGDKTKAKMIDMKNKLFIFSESVISKMPKKFSSILELKKALNKLENINKSVDELMSLNSPYGENFDKYAQLSKYIIKANSIQSEISRHIKR